MTSPLDWTVGDPITEAHWRAHSALRHALRDERENAERLRGLLDRWLAAAGAMGSGNRAVLTQDTLDAVGMPDA